MEPQITLIYCRVYVEKGIFFIKQAVKTHTFESQF